MRLPRQATKVLLTLTVLCETGSACQLWRPGPPMEMVATGEQSFRMVRIPPSASDWTVDNRDCLASRPYLVPPVVQAKDRSRMKSLTFVGPQKGPTI
jgi:hypothetical protein